jgi:hypothetical protein
VQWCKTARRRTDLGPLVVILERAETGDDDPRSHLMHASIRANGLLAAAFLAGAAGAQVTFLEAEPNGQKFEATPVLSMNAGDSITGSSTGTSTAVNLPLIATADTFLVQTAPAPLGIYRHMLKVTSAGPSGHTGRILGLFQSNGVILSGETTFQFSSNATAQNENVWYGFGKQDSLFYRVVGTVSTTSPYAATLTTTAVTPIVVAGQFAPGPVTVTTVGQGHTSDTEIYLYDGALNPVPLGHNDQTIPGDPTLSSVTVTLAPGTYYAAVSSANTANNQSDANPTELYDDDAVLDYPDVIANSHGNSLPPFPVSFAISDGASTVQVPAQLTLPFEIVWARFTVGTSGTVYCSGDGSGTACPCGNAGAPGNGCASSVDALGAHLGATGAASIASDTFVLVGSNMPNSSALYFQGTSQTAGGAGSVFGDGLRCASGSVIRLGTKTNAGGSSSYPAAGDAPVSVKGVNSAGAVRDYQIWYRNAAAFCTIATFNLSNGLQVTWAP